MGAQGTLVAGGRYDGLIEQLGGPHTPAVGWAAGIERLAMLIGAPKAETPLITVIPENPESESAAIEITNSLRASGIVTDLAFRGNARKRFELAKKNNSLARLVVMKSGETGLPDRIGYQIRINEPESHDRASVSLKEVILERLEQRFKVNRFEPKELGWSPDAVLQPKNEA